jgi:hypothetical protein
MRRLFAVLAVLAIGLLAGCSLGPQKEALETAIPAALLASDLGITKAEASVGIDGFSKNLEVFAVFDRDTVSVDDLVQILKLSIDNADRDSFSRIIVGARDGTVDGHEYIDLGAIGQELGYPADNLVPERFSIGWDEAIDLVEQ